jgi:hypothetical protein
MPGHLAHAGEVAARGSVDPKLLGGDVFSLSEISHADKRLSVIGRKASAYYRLLRHLLSEKLQASYMEDQARPLPPRMVDLLKTLEHRKPPETHKTLGTELLSPKNE